MKPSALFTRLSPRLATLGAAVLAALISLLPFARGLVQGHSFFFRDLARYFFPMRRFYTEGLLKGELRLWNPLVNEGSSDMALCFYPGDLLQLVRNDEWLFTLLLALHVALAAAAMTLLLRSLATEAVGAVGGGLLYALGGFSLSLINLDLAVRAFAWAPLIILSLRRAADGGRRETALAAVVCGVALSILSPEILAQAMLAAIALAAWPLARARLGRIVAGLSLGIGLAAAPLLLQARLIPGSARGALLGVGNLENSVSPAAWLQLFVANLFGDLSRIGIAWWGQRHFAEGFPYILSLYVGPTAIALAAVGLGAARTMRKRLLAMLIVGVVVSLGSYAGLDVILAAVPAARLLRYPVKAFFAVQLVLSLAAGAGLSALARGARGPWKAFTAGAAGLGGSLAATLALMIWTPALVLDLFRGFFPGTEPVYAWRWTIAFILRDAAVGGVLALAAALCGALVLTHRLRPALGAALATGLLVADLLRAGAGLNPMVTPGFYRLSEQSERLRVEIAQAGGRVFSCDVVSQGEYLRARRVARDQGVSFPFAALIETFTPHTNVSIAVPTAMSADLNSLLPVERTLSPLELQCGDFPAIRERLWAAGVTHVLSADPITSEGLEWTMALRPERLAPLAINVYRFREPLPRIQVAAETREVASREQAELIAREPGFLARGAVALEGEAGSGPSSGRARLVGERPGRLLLEVEARTPTVVVVRDSFESAWHARVNGTAAPVLRANGRHIAVPVPAGLSHVELVHRPWQLNAGLAVGAFSALAIAALFRRQGQPRRVGPR